MLKFLYGSTMEGGTLYPPNTKMSDFKRQMIIFVQNFVPSNDESISPNWFFTLGKMGKPNQVSWMMPFLVLGKCTWRYSLRKFDDVDSAMRFNINRTILSNHSMLFGGKRQAHWQHCILQQTGSVDRSNLWKISWEALCQDFGRGWQLLHHYYRKTCLGRMQGVVPWGEDSQSTKYSTWKLY